MEGMAYKRESRPKVDEDNRGPSPEDSSGVQAGEEGDFGIMPQSL